MRDEIDLQACVAALEASGDYRVLHRLQRPPSIDRANLPAGAREAIVLDVETTGLKAPDDTPFEIALVRFAYNQDGAILGVTGVLEALEDPGRPIPPEIVELTGVSDADVQGKRFPDADIEAMLDDVPLVIAHNASFDRPIAERRFPSLQKKHWACSANEVEWRNLKGRLGGSLAALAASHGFFFAGHRAAEDCFAVLEVLSRPVDDQHPNAFAELRSRALQATVRLWAKDSPFDKKETLKARKYRFSGERKTWYRELPEADLEAEIAWLEAEIYAGRMPELPRERFDARDRWSVRTNLANHSG